MFVFQHFLIYLSEFAVAPQDEVWFYFEVENVGGGVQFRSYDWRNYVIALYEHSVTMNIIETSYRWNIICMFLLDTVLSHE